MHESQLVSLVVTIFLVTMILVTSCSSSANAPPPPANSQSNPGSSLIGRWRLISPADEDVTMVITSDGKLTYSIHSGDKTQIIDLVYEVAGEQIITDQPSHPRREITTFSFDSSGILVLDQNGEKSRFTREE